VTPAKVTHPKGISLLAGWQRVVAIAKAVLAVTAHSQSASEGSLGWQRTPESSGLPCGHMAECPGIRLCRVSTDGLFRI